MAHFYEYLEFNSDEDRENQLEVYVDVKLQAETEEKLKSLAVQGDWLVMAEPYCPDCVEIVAYFQRMAKLNPNINVKYVARKDNKERQHFDSDEQQQAVISAEKIPSIFNISGGKTELVLCECSEPKKLRNVTTKTTKENKRYIFLVFMDFILKQTPFNSYLKGV